MYPDRELSRLSLHKEVLRLDITLRRAEFAVAAGRVAEPFSWLDRAVAFCRKISPFAALAAVPLALFAARPGAPRKGILGTLLRWAPAVLGALRSFGRR